MTMAMELIRHIAGLYSGKAIKGDFTQVYITGNEIWMAQQILAEQAEGVQGERERFEVEMLELCLPIERDSHGAYVSDHVRHLWSGWELRAALAQPSPKCTTCDDNGRIGGPSFYAPDEGGEPCPDCAQPSPAPELERPEVVAWMWRDINGDMQFNYMHPEGEPLMTVAQHERIVTAWRHLKDVKYAELYEEAVQLEAKIDAAQAKLAELERQEPVYTKPSWADSYGWSGGYIDFKCATDVEKLARHFEDLLDAVPEGPLYAAPVAQAGQAPQAWLDVQAERRRQIEAEDWTPEHDDEHSHGQMARAAACYALAGSSAPNDGTAALLVSLAWPWDQQWWKPTTARRDLIKACALALAEIERLDRAAAPQPAGGE